ncbi:hypothetical protein [Rahnella sp. WP5]|uniref:hypothetical protein n=1 Tax=Rahnella sp. WP5 TaxID=1500266 RepID=UPI000567EBC6|nr:hypothetical protein [Rahnella sp. WP5]
MSHNKPLLVVAKGAAKWVIFAVVNVWDFFESVLFVGGLIGSLMLPVVWPMKFVYAAGWLVCFFCVSKCIGKIEGYRKKSRNIKLRK